MTASLSGIPIPGPGSERNPSSDGFFPSELEGCIASSQEPLAGLQPRWPRDVELGIAAQGSIYHGYPYLFLGAFPSLASTPERVEPLALACRLLADSLFVADDIMDEDPTDRERTANILRLQAMQFEAYRLLHGLFPPQTPFWSRLQTYLAVYAKACLTEKHFAAPGTGWTDLSQGAAIAIARGKSSLANLAVAGLAELAEDEGPFEPLTGSVGRYYVARQLVDDLTDWRDDLRRGVPSLLLARVAALEFSGDSKEELTRQIDRTTRAIYFGGHGREALELALQVLAAARREAAPYPDLPWQRLLNKLDGHCKGLLQDLDRLTGADRRSGRRTFELRVPPAESPWEEMAWKALGEVLERWRPVRSETSAKADEDDGPDDGVQEVRWRRAAPGGDLMARTLVAQALVDANEALGGQLEELLQDEIEYLLRRNSEVGGWGLSAVFPGLPGDANHLAHAMRILLLTGHREEVRKCCEAPLRTLLREGERRDDGALPIWVRTDGKEPPPGGRPDPAVMAHLLHALWLYDSARFANPLEAGVRWLETRQQPEGSWTSPACHGPLQPTTTVLAMMAAVDPASPSVAAAAEFVRTSQRPDGGWGSDPESSDPTSTALAVLGLAHAQRHAGEDEDVERARRGRELLRRTLDEKPPVTGGRILTAALILRAALLWHRLESRSEARIAGRAADGEPVAASVEVTA